MDDELRTAVRERAEERCEYCLLREEHAPVVEQVGIDEGYLVLADGDLPEQAAAVQQAIREQVRLSASLGVATCKVVCKIASDMRKPGGITYVPAGEEAAFLAPLEVRRLPGVGPKSEQRLRRAPVVTKGSFARSAATGSPFLPPGWRKRRRRPLAPASRARLVRAASNGARRRGARPAPVREAPPADAARPWLWPKRFRRWAGEGPPRAASAQRRPRAVGVLL